MFNITFTDDFPPRRHDVVYNLQHSGTMTAHHPLPTVAELRYSMQGPFSISVLERA